MELQLHTNEQSNEVEERRNCAQKKRGTVFVYISALTACFLSVGVASSAVWTSPVLAKLRTNDSEINPLGTPITTFQESMIGGAPSVGAVLGCLFLAKISDVIGRKTTMLILAIMQVIATCALAYSRLIMLYYITRFILGIGMSAGLSTLSVFLSEISEDHTRSQIGTFLGLAVPVGNLYVYALGPFLSVKTFTLVCGVPYILVIIFLLAFVPESPIFLASKGRRAEAIKALEKLRNKPAGEIEKEYEVILATLKITTKRGSLRQFFQTKASRKALLITVVCYVVMQFSGIIGILAFAGPLFDEAKTGLSGNSVAILLGTVKFLSTFIAMATVERMGKRPLLLLSTMGSFVSHCVSGAFFYLQSKNDPVVEYILWLPILAVLFFVLSYGIGLGPTPTTLPAEMFPADLRSMAASFGTFVHFIVAMVVMFSFPVFVRVLGPAWCLWGYAVACLLGFVFVYFVVPEIKGKSLVEVQELLSR